MPTAPLSRARVRVRVRQRAWSLFTNSQTEHWTKQFWQFEQWIGQGQAQALRQTGTDQSNNLVQHRLHLVYFFSIIKGTRQVN